MGVKSKVWPAKLETASAASSGQREQQDQQRPINQHVRSAKYHSKGIESLKELLRLYMRMLFPVAIISVWMFGYFAFTAYAVPNIFCKSSVIAAPVSVSPRIEEHIYQDGPKAGRLQGTTTGFTNCVYNAGSAGQENSYTKTTGFKTLWLLFSAVQQAWVTGFCAVMGRAMFRHYVTWKHWAVIIFMSAATAAVMIVGAPAYHLNLNDTIFIVLPGMPPLLGPC